MYWRFGLYFVILVLDTVLSTARSALSSICGTQKDVLLDHTPWSRDSSMCAQSATSFLQIPVHLGCQSSDKYLKSLTPVGKLVLKALTH